MTGETSCYKDVADALLNIQELSISQRTYPVSAYIAAPDDLCKGVVPGLGPGTPSHMLVEEMQASGIQILQARMMDQTNIALVTFEGLRVPRFVRFLGAEIRCYPHHPRQPICKTCLKLGHRADHCPTPDVTICAQCGIENRAPSHPCFPRCKSCGGDHPTPQPKCPQCQRQPFNRAWVKKAIEDEQRQLKASNNAAPSSEITPVSGTSFKKAGRPRSKTPSRSHPKTRANSKSRSRSRFQSSSARNQVKRQTAPVSQASPLPFRKALLSKPATSVATPDHQQPRAPENTNAKVAPRQLDAAIERINARMQAAIERARKESLALRQEIISVIHASEERTHALFAELVCRLHSIGAPLPASKSARPQPPLTGARISHTYSHPAASSHEDDGDPKQAAHRGLAGELQRIPLEKGIPATSAHCPERKVRITNSTRFREHRHNTSEGLGYEQWLESLSADLDVCGRTVQAVNIVPTYARQGSLSCAPQKSELVLIGARSITPPPKIMVHVDGVPLPQVDRARILGRHVQANAKVNYTASLLSRHTEQTLAMIRRVSNRCSAPGSRSSSASEKAVDLDATTLTSLMKKDQRSLESPKDKLFNQFDFLLIEELAMIGRFFSDEKRPTRCALEIDVTTEKTMASRGGGASRSGELAKNGIDRPQSVDENAPSQGELVSLSHSRMGVVGTVRIQETNHGRPRKISNRTCTNISGERRITVAVPVTGAQPSGRLAAVRLTPPLPHGYFLAPLAFPHRRNSPTTAVTRIAQRHYLAMFLLLTGDVSPNPGAPQPTCASCTKRMRDDQAALCCDSYDGWFHRRCVHLSMAQYRKLGPCNDPWMCPHDSMPPGKTRMALELWYTNCLSVDLQSPIAALPANTVILLTETCLDPGVLDGELMDISSHTIFRRDRRGRGGVALVATPHDEPLSSDAADDSLRDTVTTADLHQVCQHPSYSSQGRASFLDLVFVRNISRVTSCEVLPGLTGSDHSAIEISYATILPRKGYFARTLWHFGRTDLAHMAQIAPLAPWCLTTGSDCSTNFDLWCDFIQEIQVDCVPQ
ncbi:hypothetical protein HPB49_013518 [Dermacentor silvarum]|uniref:Uncharacterized protein n=1 Tax=Dermacentor silvarum TaxID=543639 RepID=A0ACB8DPG7_DERSI|nr:hypothetical protein HPB49_013518 [Dermacentor silvarum]